MRLFPATLLALTSLTLAGCAVLSSQPPSARWTTGFWFWQGSSIDPLYSGETLDVLFVQAGTIRKETGPGLFRRPGDAAEQWHIDASLPTELPPAREYWLVYRYAGQGVPDLQVAPEFAETVTEQQAQAQERHLHIAGIQLDVDSPTSALPRYAEWIREVRKALPANMQVSITALLDWFRNGTSVQDVIAHVDEFVPQFYDVSDPASRRESAVAAPIDAARWGPVFNRFRKRFRIGVSSFGRARVVRRESPAQGAYARAVIYGDLRPLDVAANPAFELRTARTAAGETVLNYTVKRNVSLGYERLDAGDIVQFTISTPDAIRSAVQSARQMTGYLAGVVFFRWPASNEDWALQPDEVLNAAGVSAARRKEDHVQVVAGRCAAVSCVDLYLESAGPLSPAPRRYRIRASTPLEYFLPEQNMPVRLNGASELAVSLPAYCARGRLYLGRAVSLQPAEFRVEDAQ